MYQSVEKLIETNSGTGSVPEGRLREGLGGGWRWMWWTGGGNGRLDEVDGRVDDWEGLGLYDLRDLGS